MHTIFSMPKAFRGHIRVIQRNAIQSWTRLSPKPEIILLGNDEGTKEIAQEFGLRHIPEVARNEYGTPLLNDLFGHAEREASYDVLCYVNADIVLLSEFWAAVQRALEKLAEFLLVSERINVDITQEISFEPGWEKQVLNLAKSKGTPCGYTGIDVFVFPRGTYPEVPDFGLGRLWFDQWLIKAALQSGIPVVDLSDVAPVIHQNHDYNHVPGGAEQVWRGKEAEYNLKLYGGIPEAVTLLDVSHKLTRSGRIRKVVLRRRAARAREFAWNVLVRRTERLRAALGLRRKSWQAEYR